MSVIPFPEIVYFRRRTFPAKYPCQALARWLERNGVSQREFALLIGVSQPAVWKWIHKGYCPSDNVIRMVTQLTDGAVTPGDWLAPMDREAGE